MNETLHRIMKLGKIDHLIESPVKEKVADAMFLYYQGHFVVVEELPTPETTKNFIKETLSVHPDIINFQVDYDAPPELKIKVINYVVDLLYENAAREVEGKIREIMESGSA